MIFTLISHHNLVPVDQNLVLVYGGVILEAGVKISTSKDENFLFGLPINDCVFIAQPALNCDVECLFSYMY
jgi:hypothetical protein